MVHKTHRGESDSPDDEAIVGQIEIDEFNDEMTVDVTDDAVTVESFVADTSGPLEQVEDAVLEPGTVLRDRFQIVAQVHSGGMSHVYKAIDLRRHRGGSEQIHVAIKMIRRSVATRVNAYLTLEREAEKAQHLSHPNIVSIYDFDRHDDQFFLVMEWLEGESVYELLRRTQGRMLDPQFAWQIIQGVANAVHHAHSNNVVHADINPANIFITDTQQIKLLDFGVARHDDEADDADSGRATWATRQYASPEVLTGGTPVFEDDIFSLGCVAYRLLSGKHPFSGRSSVVAKEAGTALQTVPELSETQWQTLSRALSFERADRPNTATVFLGELPASAAHAPTAGGVERAWRADWRLLLPVAAVVLLAGLWWLTRPADTTRPAAVATPSAEQSTVGSPELNQLLASAARAMDENRLVEPEGDNARRLYRDALGIDPSSQVAQSGMRRISDAFVAEANLALQAGAPAEAIAALAVAAETDAANPAIAIVQELLRVQGATRLANARLAASQGETERAAGLLAQAELYAGVDPAEIETIRRQLAENADERQFLDRLAVADAHIAAGRLVAPRGNNAHTELLGLRTDHPADERLQASLDRLGQRLLTRAAFASAAGRTAEATGLLDSAAELGVLSAEIEEARQSLRRAANDRAATRRAAAEDTAPAADDSRGTARTAAAADDSRGTAGTAAGAAAAVPEAPTAAAAASAAAEVTEAATDDAAAGAVAQVPEAATEDMANAGTAREESASAETAAVAAASSAATDEAALAAEAAAGEGTVLPDPPDAASSGAGAAEPGPPTSPRVVKLSEMSIEKYVAPEFPPRAAWRGLAGSVALAFTINPDGTTGDIEVIESEPGSIFDASAENAVRQWRFAPPDEAVRARITLRFALNER